jgi:hypothetical protein
MQKTPILNQRLIFKTRLCLQICWIPDQLWWASWRKTWTRYQLTLSSSSITVEPMGNWLHACVQCDVQVKVGSTNSFLIQCQFWECPKTVHNSNQSTTVESYPSSFGWNKMLAFICFLWHNLQLI